jgi:hypothetical protein
MLEVAAILCFLIGIIHSYLGERFILIRLFRGDRVPHLFGSDYFPKRTLRFAWHITTFTWWGYAYLLFVIAAGEENLAQSILYTISAVFLFSGLFSFGFTKGKHLSWVVFWAIAGLSYYAASNG